MGQSILRVYNFLKMILEFLATSFSCYNLVSFNKGNSLAVKFGLIFFPLECVSLTISYQLYFLRIIWNMLHHE